MIAKASELELAASVPFVTKALAELQMLRIEYDEQREDRPDHRTSLAGAVCDPVCVRITLAISISASSGRPAPGTRAVGGVTFPSASDPT